MARKKATLKPPNAVLPVIAQNSTNNGPRRRPPRERLPSSVLEELWSIWQADPRVPSIKSRRSWAISRNASPRLVDHWFLRRKTFAKKAGQPISNESYDLSVDPPIVPKREQSTTPLEPELETLPDLPSDDTLVYPPDHDDLYYIEASSDTVFDEDALVEVKRTETPAYKEVFPTPEHHRAQQEPSSSDLYAAEDRPDENVPAFEDFSFLICNQGQGKQSDFTCVLCSANSDQGTPEGVLSDSTALSDSTDNPFDLLHLDFFPDTFSELSAIPFLFRTPRAVLPDNAVKYFSVDEWTVVEDELEGLVKDGRLDFSFLDVPHLACMDLID